MAAALSPIFTSDSESSDYSDAQTPSADQGQATPTDSDGALERDEEKDLGDTKTNDPDLVAWNGPDDPANPKNWSFARKWAATAIVSLFSFISPVSSSMIAPALPALDAEFHITNSVESQIMLSVFVLAYAIGPLFLGPLSEVYGRSRVIQLANLFYLVFNTACGGAKTRVQMTIFRFLAGLGGSAPLSVGGGVLGDLFDSKDRGKAIAIYSLMPLLGPALGPIMGGFVSENTTWRWIFYATSCFDALVLILGFFLLQETYTPVLLQRKRDKLIKQTNNNLLHTQYDNVNTLAVKLGTGFTRPFILLFTQPIIQALAIYMSITYGLTYLVLSTFSSLFTSVYHESVGISSLNYLSIAIGCAIGAQTSAFATDRLYKKLTARDPEGKGHPEFRIPFILVGAVLVPVGLLWYGWSAQAHNPWIVPNLGIAVFAAGLVVVMTSMQAYILDTYPRYAASALAAVGFLRATAGFGFPLFAPAMYNALGYGWGNSVLALVAIVAGSIGPLGLWRYGSWLRARSPFASEGL